MLDAIKTMINWFQAYFADGFFLILAIPSYIYLFITSKNVRVRLLLPIAMVVFCLINPLLYKLVLEKTIYWRLFWMIPDAIIIAIAVTSLIKRCNSDWLKLVILGGMTVLIMAKGTNAFVYGNFTKVQNWVKLAGSTVTVCDTIREIETSPKVLFPRSLYCEVRQYAPEIEMMYGRNGDGYIYWCPPECLLTIWQMENREPNFAFIFKQAGLSDCDFVVLEEAKAVVVDSGILEQYQYTEVARTSGYVIYYNPAIH